MLHMFSLKSHLGLLLVVSASFAADPVPVALWSFDGDKADIGKAEGGVIFQQDGPSPKQFKNIPASNKAARFEGAKGGFIRVTDPGEKSLFDFDNGDAITIEAWVNPASAPKGGNVYIIGKGRTSNPGQEANNQNYGLRLWDSGGFLRPSFLFRSRKDGDHVGDWHRWTTTGGIATGSGWHHVAVTYEFGKPETIRGYIDGELATGAWDMGGATKQAPVVDNDEVWLGTSMGKKESVSFDGLMDEVRLYRGILPEKTIAARYPVEPYTPILPEGGLPKGKVRVEIVESIGKAAKWPRQYPQPVDVYEEDVFGFFQIAQKYTDTGVRAERSNPYLLRALANIALPVGKQELLMRVRGQGRLWMDGKVIAEIAFGQTGGGAHNEVEHAEVEKSGPVLRFLGPGDREMRISIESDGKPHDYVFEMIAGNGRVRTTLGETSLSLRHADGMHTLLTPSEKIVPLTDEGWADFRKERLAFYAVHDQKQRQNLRAKQDTYWAQRHEQAREVIAKKKPLKQTGIDTLLAASWDKANTAGKQAAGGIDFAKQIKPILAENCFRCHEEKAKGGLRLNTLEAARKGGESGKPAIVPGKPAESQLISMIHPDAGDEIMPPKGDPLSDAQRQLLADWITQGASFASASQKIEPTALTEDLEFLRRVTLDTVGVVPSATEIDAFLAEDSPQRRERAVDRLLKDARWADHWTAYWQDVLAENPNILKPSLNNSGPFRFWIHEALSDNLPMDRFVTELVRMEGGVLAGGPAGFSLAAENDVPMAAKAHILSTAFLGQEMTCARCHDSPYHQSKQRDLFEMAAMLNRKAITLPATSSVPMTTFAGRKPLIPITLKPGEVIVPAWPSLFEKKLLTAEQSAASPKKDDSREQLAALITSPQNERFAQVIVNRIWKQLMGRGFVEPVDDWEASKPTHPELLEWLAREFVAHNYDMKHLQRLILTSEAYQRETRPLQPGTAPDFAAPLPRRMTAEQIVDSLFAAVGKDLDSEELTMDNDGTQSQSAMISLGHPRRAWEFTSLSNERDRPSLAIPKAQAIVDVLENFGWRSSRQDPKSVRETAANVRQPAILANGMLGRWVTTLSEKGSLTALAMQKEITTDQLIEQLFLRLLTRRPTSEERATFAKMLSPGFAERIIPEGKRPPPIVRPPLKYVAWSNHLSAGANSIKIEMEKRAREGDPPTTALSPDWRERLEDMTWAVLNSPEFVHLP
jgi:mono/diheme cytochrome c family protein